MPKNALAQSSGSDGKLKAKLEEPPRISFDFYSYGILMTQRNGNISRTQAVHPDALSAALAQNYRFQTGLLHRDILYMSQSNKGSVTVEYRKPQVYGIWIDGVTNALHVPLPGLVLIRSLPITGTPSYALFAVKRRPGAQSACFYDVPLPNVNSGGIICWGNVPRPSADQLQPNNLAADWRTILGSAFGNHSTFRKSKQYPDDIRKQLIALDAAKAKRYPNDDLVRVDHSFESVLKLA